MSEGLHPGMALLIEHAGRTWRTEVVRASDPLRVHLGDLVPEELADLPAGTTLACRFHRPEGVVRFDSNVLGRCKDEGRECLSLAPPEHMASEKRRRHLRISRRIDMRLRLPLKNDALSRAKGRDYLYDAWIEAVAVNISAGGFRARLELPRHHSPAPHRQALVRFELEGRAFKDCALVFVRRDWNQDETIHVYQFASLDDEATDWIERHNLRWMQRKPGAEFPEIH